MASGSGSFFFGGPFGWGPRLALFYKRGGLCYACKLEGHCFQAFVLLGVRVGPSLSC